jgi:hypothetical protein
MADERQSQRLLLRPRGPTLPPLFVLVCRLQIIELIIPHLTTLTAFLPHSPLSLLLFLHDKVEGTDEA